MFPKMLKPKAFGFWPRKRPRTDSGIVAALALRAQERALNTRQEGQISTCLQQSGVESALSPFQWMLSE